MAFEHDIIIISKSGNKVEDIELLEVAAKFFLVELGKKRKFKPLTIEVRIEDDIVSESAKEHLSGDMEEIKNFFVDPEGNTSYYVCRIADYINSAETMRTLAHELVHVWQTATGRLSTDENTGWFWKGKSYGMTPYKGNDSDYDLPWEREADTLDLQMVRKFYKQYFSQW